MKILYAVLIVGIAMLCLSTSVKADNPHKVDENGELCKEPQINILLVGNSLTKNGTHKRGRTVQVYLKKMAAASGKNVHVQTVAGSGASFRDFAGMRQRKIKRAKRFRKALKSRDWDYVILQEKTKHHYVEAETRSLPALDTLLGQIKKESPDAKVLLYLPRGYDSYAGNQITSEEALKMEAYIGAAGVRIEEEFGLDLISVGMQFYRCGILYPDIQLIGADKNHPTRAGYFLAASCIYQKIFGNKPVISQEVLQFADISRKEAEQLLGLWGEGISSKMVERLLFQGDKVVMELDIPEDMVGAEVRFESMNPEVATVDAISGEITAVSGGMAVIMAETDAGWQTYCTVFVSYNPPEKITSRVNAGVDENGQNVNSVVLRWKRQPGAQYEVYRSKEKRGPYKLLELTKRRKYVDTTVQSGQTWYYKLVAVNEYSACESAASEVIKVVIP